RAVRVAVEEGHADLPAHARQDDRAAEPDLRDADPAARGVILLAFAIPVEADLDAAVFVDVDRLLLLARAGDDRRLDAVDARLPGADLGREGRPLGDSTEAVLAGDAAVVGVLSSAG